MSQNQRNLYEILKDRRHRESSFSDISKGAKNSYDLLMRLGVQREVHGHNGCVNSVRWSNDGQFLLTGADDKYLHIYSYPDYQVREKIRSGHRSNIYNAKFLPHSSNTKIVSCSNDGEILYNDIMLSRNYGANRFTCHSGVVYDVITHNHDPYGFLSCSEDMTIRYFDLRVRSNCESEPCNKYVLIRLISSITACAVNPYNINEISAACSDGTILMFDRRMVFTCRDRILRHNTYTCDSTSGCVLSYKFHQRHCSLRERGDRMTCLTYNETGDELLASYIPNAVVLLSTRPKKNVTAEDIMRVRKVYKDNIYLMPGDLRYQRRVGRKVTPVQRSPKRFTEDKWLRRLKNANYNSEFRNMFFALRHQVNSDDYNQNFARDEDSSFNDVVPDPRSESLLTYRNMSNDIDFFTDSNSGIDRSLHFQHGLPFENTDPTYNNENSAEWDECLNYLTDVSNSYHHLHEVNNSRRLNGEGAIFNLPKEKFFDPYDWSVLDEITPYDRLGNYSNGVFVPEYVSVYRGHCNSRTVIKECNFYGDKYIISGSDCGNCFVWDRHTKDVVHIFKGDGLIVNSVQPHPNEPVIACSGIDHTTKIIAPVLPRPQTNPSFDKIIRENNDSFTRRSTRTGRYMFSPSMIFQVLTSLEHENNNPSDIIMRAIQISDGTTVFYDGGNASLLPRQEHELTYTSYTNFVRSEEIPEETNERNTSPSDDYNDFPGNEEWSISHTDSNSSSRLFDYES